MRNNRLIIAVLLLMLTLVSCEPNTFRYRDEYQELYSAANYSILGMETRDSDRVIEVEKDNYGRVLYLVLSSSPVSSSKRVVVLGIVQSYTDTEVQYYEKINVVCCFADSNAVLPFTEEVGRSFFTEDQIENLKEANDWEKEFDETKCTRQAVCTCDGEIQPISEAKETRIVKDLFGNYSEVSIDYLAPYSDGTIVGLIECRTSEVEYYILILTHRTGQQDETVICEKIDGLEDQWQLLEKLLSNVEE